jgi:hypothetical protein
LRRGLFGESLNPVDAARAVSALEDVVKLMELRRFLMD